MIGLASSLPERRGDTMRYAPLVLAAARAAGLSNLAVIHVDRVLAVLTYDDPTRLASMTWGDLVGVIRQAVALANNDARNWLARAAARGFTHSGHTKGRPTWNWACAEAVADDTLDALANRLTPTQEN